MPMSSTTAPGLIQAPGIKPGFADGDSQDVGLANMVGQVPRETVADRDGRSRQQQFQRQRPPDVIRGADDHGVLALHRARRCGGGGSSRHRAWRGAARGCAG